MFIFPLSVFLLCKTLFLLHFLYGPKTTHFILLCAVFVRRYQKNGGRRRGRYRLVLQS